MMSKIGYTGGFETVADLQDQTSALEEFGCDIVLPRDHSVYTEACKNSLSQVLAAMGEGDTLVVTRIDRLASSLKELQTVVSKLEDKRAYLVVTEQGIDTANGSSIPFPRTVEIIRNLEARLHRERQVKGIACAKAKGVYTGGKSRVDRGCVLEAIKRGEKPSAVAKKLGCSTSTVYRIRAEESLG